MEPKSGFGEIKPLSDTILVLNSDKNKMIIEDKQSIVLVPLYSADEY